MVSVKYLVAAALAVPLAVGGLVAAQSDDMGVAALGTTPAGVALMAQLRAAHDGAVITLESKDYGVVTFPAVRHATPIRIKAAGARFTGIVLRDADGVAIEGGRVNGPGGRSYGVQIHASGNISVSGMTITGAHRGVTIGSSHDVAILSNTLTGLLSDGVDIALSRRIVVRGNSCSNFTPSMDTVDAAGKRVAGGGDHPDCIQAWSRPTAPPTADVVVENNRVDGKMQGVFFGNHVRGGIDDGGFDRVVVRGNIIRSGLYNGIALYGARDSLVSGNTVSTVPGSVNPRRGVPIRSRILIDTSERTLVCGNTVADFPGSPPTMPCPNSNH